MSTKPYRYHWGKFFWDAWLNDLNLQNCDMAAQGLWMNMLCLMHKSENIGFLMIQGKPMSVGDIAKRVGMRKDRTERLLKILMQNGVCSINQDGVLYSRRIAREEQARLSDNIESSTDAPVDIIQDEQYINDNRVKHERKSYDYRKNNQGKSTVTAKTSLIQKKEIEFKKEIQKKKIIDDVSDGLSTQLRQTLVDRLTKVTNISDKKAKEKVESWFIQAGCDGEIVLKAIELSYGKTYPVAYISKVISDLAQRLVKSERWQIDEGNHSEDKMFQALSRDDQLIVLQMEKKENHKKWFLKHIENYQPMAFNYLSSNGLIPQWVGAR